MFIHVATHLQSSFPGVRISKGDVPAGTKLFDLAPRSLVTDDDPEARPERFHDDVAEVFSERRKREEVMSREQRRDVVVSDRADAGGPNVCRQGGDASLAVLPVR